MWNFLAAIAISIALSVLAYMLMPKPSTDTGRQSQNLREPQAEAGIPLPVVFGEVTIMSPNVMWYGDIDKIEYEVNA